MVNPPFFTFHQFLAGQTVPDQEEDQLNQCKEKQKRTGWWGQDGKNAGLEENRQEALWNWMPVQERREHKSIIVSSMSIGEDTANILELVSSQKIKIK